MNIDPAFWSSFWPGLLASLPGTFLGVFLAAWVARWQAKREEDTKLVALIEAAVTDIQHVINIGKRYIDDTEKMDPEIENRDDEWKFFVDHAQIPTPRIAPVLFSTESVISRLSNETLVYYSTIMHNSDKLVCWVSAAESIKMYKVLCEFYVYNLAVIQGLLRLEIQLIRGKLTPISHQLESRMVFKEATEITYQRSEIYRILRNAETEMANQEIDAPN